MANIREDQPQRPSSSRPTLRPWSKDGEQIRGKRVLVIEDGPTVTHGGMELRRRRSSPPSKYGAAEIVDPRPAAVGSIKATFEKYNHLEKVLPAMGYGEKQVRELAETIERIDCDLIVSGTPIDLNRLIKTQASPCSPSATSSRRSARPTSRTSWPSSEDAPMPPSTVALALIAFGGNALLPEGPAGPAGRAGQERRAGGPAHGPMSSARATS